MRDAAEPVGSTVAAPAIALVGVEKSFETHGAAVHALAPIDLEVAAGEMVLLLGPSGCGKTTLLRIIGGLTRPSRGSVRISGHPLWQNGNRQSDTLAELAMVFQEPNLFPWLTVEHNITLPLALRRQPKALRRERSRQLIAFVGIGGFEHHWPRELSGGMRQRVAIARALSYDPQILLMDEPFGALDSMTRDTMNLELQRIWMETRKTILLVTHSISEAVFLADRIVVLSARPGQVDTVMTVPFARPRSLDLQATSEYQGMVMKLRQRIAAVS